MASSSLSFEPAAPMAGVHLLMERYVDGDERAFGQLYDRLMPRIRARLGRLVRDGSVLDDLVQLTFMRAHVARHRFEPTLDHPDRAVEAWYAAIARNVALDALRRRYRRDERHRKLELTGELQGYGASAAQPNPEALGVEREELAAEIDRVRLAIAQLPEGQREVVQLHKIAGLTMSEVAERLGARPGAIRVRAHRAYKTLANLLVRKPFLALSSPP